jgi:hypothetical protein
MRDEIRDGMGFLQAWFGALRSAVHLADLSGLVTYLLVEPTAIDWPLGVGIVLHDSTRLWDG